MAQWPLIRLNAPSIHTTVQREAPAAATTPAASPTATTDTLVRVSGAKQRVLAAQATRRADPRRQALSAALDAIIKSTRAEAPSSDVAHALHNVRTLRTDNSNPRVMSAMQRAARVGALGLFTAPEDAELRSLLEHDLVTSFGVASTDLPKCDLQPHMKLADLAMYKCSVLMTMLGAPGISAARQVRLLRELGSVAIPDDIAQITAMLGADPHPRVAEAAAVAIQEISRGARLTIVLAAMEAQPYCGTGGLGNVMGELPSALAAHGHEVIVFVPKHGVIEDNIKRPLSRPGFRGSTPGPLGDTPFELFHDKREGVDYYFIGNEQFFPASDKGLYGSPYGSYDFNNNAERYDFFGASVPEAIKLVMADKGAPDILHLNDAHTASAAAYFKSDPYFAKARSLFTIHNLGGLYQGKFGKDIAANVRFNEMFRPMGPAEYRGDINFMKLGITQADGSSSVSQVYTEEILTAELGEGLHNVLGIQKAKGRLDGILNGIDATSWNPATDPALPHHYTIDDLSGKAANKEALQREYGFTVDAAIPLIGVVSRITEQKGFRDTAATIEALLAKGTRVQFVISGDGDMPIDAKRPSLKAWLRDMDAKYPGTIKTPAFNKAVERRIIASSDMFMMPSVFEPCGLPQMYALRYLTAPIVRAVGGLAESITDYDPHERTGLGFKFDKDLTACVERALEWYERGPSERLHLQRNAAEADFSWKRAVGEYVALYRKLLHRPKVGARALIDLENRITEADIESLQYGTSKNPHGVLGPHLVATETGPRTLVRFFAPQATWVRISSPPGARPVGMHRVGDSGIFEAAIPDGAAYEISTRVQGDVWVPATDPYRFAATISASDLWLFSEGRMEDVDRMLGARELTIDGEKGYAFSTWAPNAQQVCVAGDWNGWDTRSQPMRQLGSTGVWEIFIPGVQTGAKYKLAVKAADGSIALRGDPAGAAHELRPGTASVTTSSASFGWTDAAWMKRRASLDPTQGPRSTYEVHMPSWRTNEDGSFKTYAQLADELIPYAKEHGFNQLELIGLLEHPLDGSWGYQVTGYYAPTARHGSPDDFKLLVDRAHAAGISILVDWVPGHFPKNTDAGLAKLDGSHLFDHQDDRQGEHKDWNTRVFNYGRHEVRSFLTGSAMRLLDEFHVDGLRVDAVASMLYLDYSRKEWIPNRHGGHENLEAVAFLQHLNGAVKRRFPGVQMIAEESTAWPNVTNTNGDMALGFHGKWNMGWMNDTLAWFQKPHHERGAALDALTKTLEWSDAEKHVLALSHDEVVHGKGSLLGKMPGDEWQKRANLRSLLSYMWFYPGQKLLFMGAELGQANEWRDHEQLSWREATPGIAATLKTLNSLYVGEKALQQTARTSTEIRSVDHTNGVLVMARLGDHVEHDVLYVHNATADVRHGYRIGVDRPGTYREIFNGDAEELGGSGVRNPPIKAEATPMHGKQYSIVITVPPLAGVAFKRS